MKTRRSSCNILKYIIAASAIATATHLHGQEQRITPSPDFLTVDSGGTVLINIIYDTSPRDEALSGLGFRLHFDASKLQFLELSNLFSDVGTVVANDPQPDSENHDNDSSTDMFVNVFWLDLAKQWPGQGRLRKTLYTANFRAVSQSTVSTSIRFTEVTTANGWTFSGESIHIQIIDDGQCIPESTENVMCLQDMMPIVNLVGFGELETIAEFSARTGQGEFKFLDDKCFTNGIYAHADSRIDYLVPDNATRFAFNFGIDSHEYLPGTDHDQLHAVFSVYTDERLFWESDEIQFMDGSDEYTIVLEDVSVLSLRTHSVGPRGIDGRHTVWANACFELASECPQLFEPVRDLGQSWCDSDWFGTFNAAFFPWIYHLSHSWMFVWEPSSPAETFLFELGSSRWYFTTHENYPSLFDHDRNSWVFYFTDTAKPREFVDLITGEFYTLP